MDYSKLNNIVTKYQNFKILPSLDCTLSSMGLDVHLDESLNAWLSQLKVTWVTYKKNPVVESHIDALFRSRHDAFRIALLFVIKCEEYKDCKPKSLPYFIVEVLHKFSTTNNILPQDDLKLPAYHIAIQQRNQHFLNLMVQTYQLTTIKDEIIPSIRDMLKNDNCRQSSQIVIAMGLFQEIPVEDLLFPLILQDKSNMIDDYLSNCPDQVQRFLLYLDKLLDKQFKLLDFGKQYAEEHNIHLLKTDKLHYKPLGKLVARLCSKFNVPIETCKNLSKNRTISGLRYLMYQRYVEREKRDSVWEDLVKDLLEQCSDAALEFIDLLVDYDRNEAMKWALHFNIPTSQLPLALRDLKKPDTPADVEPNWEKETKIDSKDFYQTTLTKGQIEIIDSGEKFNNLLSSNVLNQSIVSVDCEWKPSFGAKQSQIALIQLGTNEKVYIIDTILLNNQSYSSFWHSFYKSFLENAEIIKIGFGLEQDLKEMQSIVSLSNIQVKGEGFLDLSLLWKSLLNHKLALPGNSDNGASLSSLVQSCFGKPLQKTEQCSNWELRPLRDTQIEYAAVDAHVLILIYKYLQNKCEDQGINFEEICNDVMMESRKKATKKPKIVDRIQQSLPMYEARSASNVRFFVDPLVTNLIFYLRYCGINSIELPTSMLWHDVINHAVSDDRFVILHKIKNTPNSKFPQSSILSVGKSTIIEQLHKIIFTYSIDIQLKNLLTLCIFCNGKDLNKLSCEEVVQTCKDFEAARGVVNTQNYRYRDDDEVDFGDFLSESEDDGEPCLLAKPEKAKACITSKGTQIVIENPTLLISTPKPGLLCQDCGKLYSEDDNFLKSIRDTVFKVTKLVVPVKCK